MHGNTIMQGQKTIAHSEATTLSGILKEESALTGQRLRVHNYLLQANDAEPDGRFRRREGRPPSYPPSGF